MCTAATYKKKDFYFGRTLDYEFSYGDEIVVCPRSFDLKFRHVKTTLPHHALIGMAHVADGYPLLYEGMNEKGLCVAGLNFVGNAVYRPPVKGAENVAQFEFIPYILTACESVKEARKLLKNIVITNEPFSEKLPVSSLHWIVADKSDCIVVESVQSGIKVYDNPAGVLTNNPPFDMQMFNLNNYMGLTAKTASNTFSPALDLKQYSRGMGALGLPGDLSSMSRFVRVAFVRANSLSGESEDECVSQFFHILGSVDQQRGCCELDGGKYEITIYTCCMNADKGIYYYTTYDNHSVTAVDMHRENLDSGRLIRYTPIDKMQIVRQN